MKSHYIIVEKKSNNTFGIFDRLDRAIEEIKKLDMRKYYLCEKLGGTKIIISVVR